MDRFVAMDGQGTKHSIPLQLLEVAGWDREAVACLV